MLEICADVKWHGFFFSISFSLLVKNTTLAKLGSIIVVGFIYYVSKMLIIARVHSKSLNKPFNVCSFTVPCIHTLLYQHLFPLPTLFRLFCCNRSSRKYAENYKKKIKTTDTH